MGEPHNSFTKREQTVNIEHSHQSHGYYQPPNNESQRFSASFADIQSNLQPELFNETNRFIPPTQANRLRHTWKLNTKTPLPPIEEGRALREELRNDLNEIKELVIADYNRICDTVEENLQSPDGLESSAEFIRSKNNELN